MGNKSFNLFLLFIAIASFLFHGSIAAVETDDELFCFSCHQYPGLVVQQESGDLKILHIDKIEYQASSHGHLDCMACHVGIDIIPHNGKSDTTCQTECHSSDKVLKLIDEIPLKGFHDKEHSYVSRLEDESSCKVCHQIYPHTKEPFLRSFLNMHTNYLVCEVCHLDRSKFTVERYGWVQAKDVYFEGKSFGSFYDPLRRLTRLPESTLSRIAPYVKREGKLQALMNTWDTESALEANSQGTRLADDVKALEIEHYHQDVLKKKKTIVCQECHSANGLIDFEAIGFSKRRSDELKNLNIANIISKYKVFHIPNF